MKRAVWALLALVALWAAWWPMAAWREASATEAWLEARRDEGWLAEAQDVRVSGFPMVYRREIAFLALADPASGWAWQADPLRLVRPRHPQVSGPERVVVFPAIQEVQTPWRRVSVASDVFELRVVPAPGADGRLLSLGLALEGLDLASGEDWRARLSRLDLTAVPDPDVPREVRLRLDASDLTPPAGVARALSRSELAPEAKERVAIDARVTFDDVWTLAAFESARPQPVRLVIEEAGLRWGELTLRVAGTLDIDAEGRPEGDVLVKVTNWRELLAAAVASGAVPEGLAGGLEGALDLASRLAGSPTTLDVPLRFADGRARFGPIPLGPAPVLRLP